MHTSALIATLALAATAFALPKANNHITISFRAHLNPDAAGSSIAVRQEQCNVVYCTQLYNICVKSCDSLTNGDW